MSSDVTTFAIAAAAFGLLAGSSIVGSEPGTYVLSRRDVVILKEGVRTDATSRTRTSDIVRRQLLQTRDEESAERLVTAIRKRLLRELEETADGMRGARFASIEAAKDRLEREERILCYDAIVWPEGFANGTLLAFVVDDEDVLALRSRLVETVRARETLLRDAVRGLVLRREVTPADSRALRDHVRARALARGHRAVDQIRGGRFFSREDAEQFVENEIASEIDQVHTIVRDPESRQVLLDEVRIGA